MTDTASNLGLEPVNEIGLAIIGCGTIGRIRAKFAREYPGVKWLGLCDINEDLGRKLAGDVNADFFTTSAEELIKRSEVNATMIITEENKHTEPTLMAVAEGHKLFIEKPLATEARESKQILDAITAAGLDACIGYTQRFRRRFLTVKERLATGQIGDVHSVVTRAFMNRMVPIATIAKTNERHNLTPMVVSGTHSLDMSMWLMEGKTPKSVYARSTDPVLAEWGTKDSTFGLFTMEDGTIFSMNISWGLPQIWPGSVYGLEIGIVGTKGVIDIEDTHRDLVLASEESLPGGYVPEGFTPAERHVDFMTSYPPGDLWQGQLWGPMREETMAWFGRIMMGMTTPHAVALEGHNNLLHTMAMDLSAKRGEEVELPIDPEEFYE
ncbi:MAG: Gfo/Idh/MocA family oxidoreductase [Rhodospirillales bacterium]|jgi:predicted dehydrogenase|nr:oxidoreductase [Rhodospirillaceae bacterium]MDP6428641.1 Gfo/Idh/MocA family oxidoreductase [Rhodospirillales bacterium]MDP6645054.1 Gfo/Idh/MocA family oxidoreductase [Rhodospirillales bacterium]MDP6842250.1 Gfo/Idh/MocA family oxidoreductase [Rhodospirillales bacterium]|tara:strand:- start:701 stop:1843 length:1143 start_codon:yes stop_codon:yes gene_type:complete